MTETAAETMTEEQLDKKMAVELFNRTWDLLDKKDRTREETDEMIHSAHASRAHWGKVGQPLHWERGEWQVSHVYAILGRAEPALYHASRCLDICRANNIADFDIVFAHEAMARALGLAGDRVEAEKHLLEARAGLAGIKDDGDRRYAESQLADVKLP